MNDHASRTVPPLVFQNQKYSHNIIIVWMKLSKKPLNKSPAHTQTRTHIISFIHLLGRSNSVAPYTRHTTHTHTKSMSEGVLVCAPYTYQSYMPSHILDYYKHTHTHVVDDTVQETVRLFGRCGRNSFLYAVMCLPQKQLIRNLFTEWSFSMLVFCFVFESSTNFILLFAVRFHCL